MRLLYKVASVHSRLGERASSHRLLGQAVDAVERLGAAVVGPLESARVLARWSILGETGEKSSEQYARQAEAMIAPWLEPRGPAQPLTWAEFDIFHGVLINGGKTFRHWERWSEAEDFFERSLRLAEAQNDPSAIGYSANNLGDVRLARGDFAGARLLHSRAATAWAQAGERWLEMAAHTHWGLDYACAGEWSAALSHLQAAQRVGESIEPTEWLASIHLCLVLALLKDNADAPAAAIHLALAEQLAAGLGQTFDTFLHPLAQAALLQQRGEDATPHLCAARGALAQGNDIYGRWLLSQFLPI